MVEYAYTTVPGKIKPLLDKLRGVGVPTKVTVNWLKTIGFTSSNDSSLMGILKFIGFIDGSNTPTSTWTSYRGANHRSVLGEAILRGYADLFAVYSDADKRTNQELHHFFSTSTTAGVQVIGKTVTTFKALAEEADFSTPAKPVEPVVQASAVHTPSAARAPHAGSPPDLKGGPEVHIDIQIHISPESTSEQIDKIFESMARHLYGRKGDR